MDLELNAQRFSGKAYVHAYDRFRPAPPKEILHQSLNYLGKIQAITLVDLGCGTGLSTQVWKDHAANIIGVEPSADMLDVAKNKLVDEAHIRFVQAFAHTLPLESDSVDIVTCSQSFHWMEPESTLQEVYRVLKKGGVLAIFDVIWPPSVTLKLEQAYRQLFETVDTITATLDKKIAYKWQKHQHLHNVEQANLFGFIKEAFYHKTESLDLEKFEGIALSQGGLEALLKRGYSEETMGIKAFRQAIEAASPAPIDEMTFQYKVIFGVK